MKYLNLNLEAFDYKNENNGESFRVRVSHSPAGDQKMHAAETVILPNTLRPRLRRLEKRTLDSQELIDMGEDLGTVLFPPNVRLLLSQSRARLADDEGLRVRLMLDTYALADLPWEYSYLSNPDTPADQKDIAGFLVLDRRISLVRYQVLEQPIARLDAVGAGPLRLVALLSNPTNTPGLNLATEQQNIEQALGELAAIKAEFYSNATVDILLEAMTRGAHIFHFSGHGKFEGEMGSSYGSQEGKGFLALTGDDGKEVAFSAQKLALSLAGRGVRFAMLGACESSMVDQVNAWTGIASALTRAGIPAVIGMQFTIKDRNAIAFTKSLYLALAAGQTIDEAASAGRQAIYIRGNDEVERDWGVPVLYLRAEEGILFPQPTNPVQALPPPNGTKAPTPNIGNEESVDRRALREALVQFFDNDELAVLCADVQAELAQDGINLTVSMEMVGGEGKRGKVLNLIQYLDRHKRLVYLVRGVRAARPDQNII